MGFPLFMFGFTVLVLMTRKVSSSQILSTFGEFLLLSFGSDASRRCNKDCHFIYEI